ncbi:MAG TPA: hypothetical protein VGF53_18140 [Pseudolabrys sp.]|jgi:hypothetical protein
MQYQLNISIDSAGVQQIYNQNQAITIVKSVVSAPLNTGNLPVAWINFQPLEENTVTWIENYNMYASTSSVVAGATIQQTSVTNAPVQTGWLYTFEDGVFTGASGGAAGTLNMLNSQGSQFTFGLSQSATVNNVAINAPLNAVPVGNNENCSFTPEENVSIFLSNVVNNGVVLSQVASNALPVTLTSQSPIANIGFTDSSNTFYLVTASAESPAAFARMLRSTRSRARA